MRWLRQADFYTGSQKLVQCLIALVLPLAGAVLVHWFYRLQVAKPYKPDRAFIPRREPAPDVLRGFHRPLDPPGD
jgi:hypothetical protein